jgi:sugar phosphate isomerase/epimerase
MSGKTAADRFSLPSVNWLRLGGAGEVAGDPEPVWPLLDVLDAAAAAGFVNVGIDLYTVRAYVDRGGRVEDLADELRSRRLTCTDVGVLPLGGTDVRAVAEEAAELAAVTAAPTCIAGLVASVDEQQAIGELRDSARILAPAGARIAIEFVAYFGVARLADAVRICSAVGWERCGLLVDTWHFFRSGAPWEELRSLDRDAIALVHVNDGPLETEGDPVTEGRFRRRLVGRGSFPLARFAATLDGLGYRGAFGVEVLSDDVRERPPADGARLLLETARADWPGF